MKKENNIPEVNPSRRKFIKSMALGAAGVAASGMIATTPAEAKSPNTLTFFGFPSTPSKYKSKKTGRKLAGVLPNENMA